MTEHVPAAPGDVAMACQLCGTPTVPGARFCFHCGAALATRADVTGEAERRIVTVLFGDLSDFTSWAEDLDPERVSGVVDRVLAALAQAVSEFGGTVDKLTGDGIMAVFGAPTAHEDDPERAVRAVARMQEAVRRLIAEEAGGGRRLGLRVGINTGEVLAGVQAGLSYTVIGDTVNTAARLSDAAGVGAVFAGRDAALATMSIASWRALQPLRLKGKRDPVPAFELLGLRTTRGGRVGLGDEVPLIGREAELGRLIGRLLDVSDRGEPASVLMLGEAGIGKSRLAQELSRFAGELPGARVLWGRCPPYVGARDFGPINQIVRTACGIEDTDDPATAARRVERAVTRLAAGADGATLAPSVVPQLQLLLGLVEPEPVLPRDLAAPGDTAPREPALLAVSRLLSSLADEGPVLVVVDDLQWAGEPLLERLTQVATGVTGRVLLLAVGRGEMLDVRPGWWRALPDPELLPVTPLEETATDRLLRAYLGGGDLDSSARALLLERAQGNPFFLGELLHLLVDRGALRRTAGGWVLGADLPADLLPAGVQAVLTARIDGLPPAAKGVLRDASVLGVRFTEDEVVAVGRFTGHGDRAGVQAALAVLSDRTIVQRCEDGSFVFAHPLARDVAYQGLPKAERARRHAAAARFAAQSAGPAAEVDAAVAAHGERAIALATEMHLPPGDPAWAARAAAGSALARLAATAQTRDDLNTADDLYARVLALGAEPQGGDPLPEDVVLGARIGRAHGLAIKHRLADAEALLAPALEPADVGLRARALVVLGEIRWRAGDHDGAIGAFVSALAAAGDAGLDRVTGDALRQLGLVHYFDGRLRQAEDQFRQAYDLADRVGDTRGAAWALQHLAWSATTRGAFTLADETLDRAADLFMSLEDTGGLSWCAGTEGFVRLLQGRFAEARELAGSVVPLGEVVGERWGVAACLTIDAIAAAELGLVAVAQEEAERARARFAGISDRWGQSLALIAVGIAARGADEHDAAIEALQQAAQLSDAGRHPVTKSLALVAEGYCHLDRRELDETERCARSALDVLSSIDLEPNAAAGGQVLLAQVLRARGDLDAAVSLFTELAESVDSPTMLFSGRQLLAHYAGTLLDAGRPDEALAIARRAVETPAEDVRSRVLALRALGAGLAATGHPVEAAEALRSALDVARSTGHRSEIAATERALAKLSAPGG